MSLFATKVPETWHHVQIWVRVLLDPVNYGPFEKWAKTRAYCDDAVYFLSQANAYDDAAFAGGGATTLAKTINDKCLTKGAEFEINIGTANETQRVMLENAKKSLTGGGVGVFEAIWNLLYGDNYGEKFAEAPSDAAVGREFRLLFAQAKCPICKAKSVTYSGATLVARVAALDVNAKARAAFTQKFHAESTPIGKSLKHIKAYKAAADSLGRTGVVTRARFVLGQVKLAVKVPPAFETALERAFAGNTANGSTFNLLEDHLDRLAIAQLSLSDFQKYVGKLTCGFCKRKDIVKDLKF